MPHHRARHWESGSPKSSYSSTAAGAGGRRSPPPDTATRTCRPGPTNPTDSAITPANAYDVTRCMSTTSTPSSSRRCTATKLDSPARRPCSRKSGPPSSEKLTRQATVASARASASTQFRTSRKSPSPKRSRTGSRLSNQTDPTGRLRPRGCGRSSRPYRAQAASRSTTAIVQTAPATPISADYSARYCASPAGRRAPPRRPDTPPVSPGVPASSSAPRPGWPWRPSRDRTGGRRSPS